MQKRYNADKNQGFTLVELSIVLLIIGLILGGIVLGSHMIQLARLRATVQQVEGLRTAFHTFKSKFNALPGDMHQNDAMSFNLTAGVCVGQPNCVLLPGIAGCHGNGDSQLPNIPNTTAACEHLGVWYHLSQAGMIAGSYNGLYIDSAATNFLDDGLSFPKDKMDKGAIAANTQDIFGYGLEGLSFQLGYSFDGPIGGVFDRFTPQETEHLDRKMDDGKPATGKVRSANPTDPPRNGGHSTQCIDDPLYYDGQSEYKLDNPDPACTFAVYD